MNMRELFDNLKSVIRADIKDYKSKGQFGNDGWEYLERKIKNDPLEVSGAELLLDESTIRHIVRDEVAAAIKERLY